MKRVCKLILFGGIVKSQFVITHVCGELGNSGKMSHEGKDRPWQLKEKFIGKPLRGQSGQGRGKKFEAAQIHVRRES